MAICEKCGKDQEQLLTAEVVEDGRTVTKQICSECIPKKSAANMFGCLLLLAIFIAPPLFLLNRCQVQWDMEAKEKADKAAADQAEDEKQKTEDQRTGKYCVSGWDGSVPTFVERVKAGLRDPSSFEHIETYVGPEDSKGRHKITMKFRSRNGFGGMNIGLAEGQFFGSQCWAVVTKMSDR